MYFRIKVKLVLLKNNRTHERDCFKNEISINKDIRKMRLEVPW